MLLIIIFSCLITCAAVINAIPIDKPSTTVANPKIPYSLRKMTPVNNPNAIKINQIL